MQAMLHSPRGNGLSLAGQDIFLEIISTHRDIHGSFYQLLFILTTAGTDPEFSEVVVGVGKEWW